MDVKEGDSSDDDFARAVERSDRMTISSQRLPVNKKRLRKHERISVCDDSRCRYPTPDLPCCKAVQCSTLYSSHQVRTARKYFHQHLTVRENRRAYLKSCIRYVQIKPRICKSLQLDVESDSTQSDDSNGADGSIGPDQTSALIQCGRKKSPNVKREFYITETIFF